MDDRVRIIPTTELIDTPGWRGPGETAESVLSMKASRPDLGPRLGRIRVRNATKRREMLRNALGEECPETRCLTVFLPESLGQQPIAELTEPSSQGGSHIKA